MHATATLNHHAALMIGASHRTTDACQPPTHPPTNGSASGSKRERHELKHLSGHTEPQASRSASERSPKKQRCAVAPDGAAANASQHRYQSEISCVLSPAAALQPLQEHPTATGGAASTSHAVRHTHYTQGAVVGILKKVPGVGMRHGLSGAVDARGTRKRVRFINVKEDEDSGCHDFFEWEADATYALCCLRGGDAYGRFPAMSSSALFSVAFYTSLDNEQVISYRSAGFSIRKS
jgi:hypothetical protein